MSANINSITFIGIDANNIDVQVHIDPIPGAASFNIVGLADKSIAESRERLRAAFSSIGLALPPKRIIINLAPSDITKDGTHFDLAIAAGLLIAMHIIPQDEISKYIVMGELSLSGMLTAVNGILPAAIAANRSGLGILCPADNVKEACYSGNKNIITPKSLLELIHHFRKEQIISTAKIDDDHSPSQYKQHELDMLDVYGQPLAKKALEIAAAGRHHMLMIGQPGSGKSMLAKRLPSIMPQLTPEEILEISIISSIAGEINKQSGIIKTRPFRSPHCSSSMAAMVGGGKNAKPGEITLAHRGVLFLDELPEFNRNVLESLRQPIEDGCISIARVNNHIRYPAKFQLIAAMNPCKCGYYGSKINSASICRKAPQCMYDYQDRISGPMFDRFDLQVETDEINTILDKQLSQGENSLTIRNRVEQATTIQKKRYQKLGWKINFNSELDGDKLNEAIKINKESHNLLEKAVQKFGMSMRGVNRVLKISRTIADLKGDEGDIRREYMAEALSYRINRSRTS